MIDFYTVTSSALGTRGRGVQLQLRGFGVTGDDDGAEGFDGAELLHPLGIESRPVITPHTEAACVWLGNQLVALGVVDQGRDKLTDLEVGETRVHAAGKPDARLRMRADGSVECEAVSGKAITLRANGATITITADGDIELAPATGRTTKLGPTATKAVAVNGDVVNASGTPVPPTGMAGWMASVTAALGGAVPPPPTQLGTVAGSTAKVRAE